MMWAWPLAVLAALVVAAWVLVIYMTRMPERSYTGPLRPLFEREQAMRRELEAHVFRLAGEIGERNVPHYERLEAAAEHIVRTLERAGYAIRQQTFDSLGRTVRNLEGEMRGTSWPEEIIVIGAHYDSVPGSPGADDNASGVAAMLVLARLARAAEFRRTLRFVAFVNEEPPYFLSSEMGSRVYAREAKRRGERVTAMLSLESVAYYADTPGSQAFPFGLRLGYPDTGNFIAIVGNLGSRSLVHRVVRVFRGHAEFPCEGMAAPAWIPGIGWSDHWSFWREGYPAVMVTDTALYRYPRYHTRLDTPDALNYDRLTRVVAGLDRVIADLGNR